MLPVPWAPSVSYTHLDVYKRQIERLRKLGQDAQPVTLETAAEFLPSGLLDDSIRKTGNGHYVAAIAYYATNPSDTQACLLYTSRCV